MSIFEQDFEAMLRQYEKSIDDKKQFTALVKDMFPQEAKNVNLILIAYNMGIAQDIQKANLLNNTFVFRYVKQLMDDYGISRENANWVVLLWCLAYGNKILKIKTDICTDAETDDFNEIKRKNNSVENDLEQTATHNQVVKRSSGEIDDEKIRQKIYLEFGSLAKIEDIAKRISSKNVSEEYVRKCLIDKYGIESVIKREWIYSDKSKQAFQDIMVKYHIKRERMREIVTPSQEEKRKRKEQEQKWHLLKNR